MKRIYHPYWSWECYHAGMFETTCFYDKPTAEKMYCLFLSDMNSFDAAIKRVLNEWPISCEQFLSNGSINRIAWLGQASMCIKNGIPRAFRGGFKTLTKDQKKSANSLADSYLRRWIYEQSQNNTIY